jgi:hypothetical protein
LKRIARALGGHESALRREVELLNQLLDLNLEQAKRLKKVEKALKDHEVRWQKRLDRVSLRHTRALRDLERAQAGNERRWKEALHQYAVRQNRERKWRVTFSRQLSAIVRRMFLPTDLPHPYGLLSRRFQLRSQFEEDGLLLELTQRAGVMGRGFVELGCGQSGNFATLALDCGWAGLLVDASVVAIEKAREAFAANSAVKLVCATVSSENVNELLSKHGFTGEVDALSIDIDSYDYWVLEAIDVCRPRVLVVEYNARFGPTRAVTIPNGCSLDSVPKGYYGASLAALDSVARRKDYRLICCEPSGANAFFIRNDLAADLPAMSPEQAFRPQLSRVEFGAQRTDETIYQTIAEQDLRLVDV